LACGEGGNVRVELIAQIVQVEHRGSGLLGDLERRYVSVHVVSMASSRSVYSKRVGVFFGNSVFGECCGVQDVVDATIYQSNVFLCDGAYARCATNDYVPVDDKSNSGADSTFRK
jgi:hypothetical protein